jgi:hypothetical protein
MQCVPACFALSLARFEEVLPASLEFLRIKLITPSQRSEVPQG